MQRERYQGLDGLRTAACIGIVLMHAMANMSLPFPGFFHELIRTFNNFVYLFMAISAFGLCCGYFEKLTVGGSFDIDSFYKKRFFKILPFYALMNLLELVSDFSVNGLHEAFANLTLTNGFLPKEFSVIGVGWFLGLVFVFYMIFPFFCFLIKTKKRAWVALAIALLLNYSCDKYFGVARPNIVYSLCYFIAGGLLYHYRGLIRNMKGYVGFPMLIISLTVYYVFGGVTITILLVTISLMALGISKYGDLLSNRFTRFISGISMEIYLSHMLFFRVAQVIGLDRLNIAPIVRYILVSAFMLAGSSVFALCFQRGERRIVDVWHKKRA